jgi:purine nucleoside permease
MQETVPESRLGDKQKAEAEHVKEEQIESQAQVTQLAAKLRDLAREVDAAANAASDSLNKSFRAAYDKIAAAPAPLLTNIMSAGKTAWAAKGLATKAAKTVTPTKSEE